MRNLMRVGLVASLLVPAAVAGMPAVAGPADTGTVAGVLRAQQQRGPAQLRRPAAEAAMTVDGLGLPTLALGGDHTCTAVLYSYVWCWGGNDHGQLGDGSTGDSATPVPAIGGLRGKFLLGLAAGRAHTCALVLDAQSPGAYCWGANGQGQLGDGSTDDQPRPKEVATEVIGLAAGGDHTCTLDTELTVSCWGRNDQGQLGIDTGGAFSSSPQEVAGLADVVEVAAGEDSTCALAEDGTASCWGGLTGSATPQAVDGHEFTRIAVGRAHACAVAGSTLRGGSVYCWGSDDSGQLGNGAGAGDSAEPVRVAGSRRYIAVSAAGDSTCALTETGQGYCWGANDDGRLGTGDTDPHGTPVAVDQGRVANSQVFRELYGAGRSMIVQLAAGPDRSCAVSVEQAVYCTRAGLLTRVPLGPGRPRAVRAVPGDASLKVSWTPPAGAAPILGYAAVAATAGLEESSECEARDRGCTIGKLHNDRRYGVFVVAISSGGFAYSSLGYAVPAGGGRGGGLPVTGPAAPLTGALVLLSTGAGLVLATRRRTPVR
jgi:alpha-tubulin suppressor-like RCC1 family protein